jgi:sugar phosphate isomerase/epimerase
MTSATGRLPSLQCSTGPFWAFDLEDAMDALADAGFKEIEFMVTRDPRTQQPDEPLRLARERGLRIASIHGPFLVITKNVWGMDPLGKIERGVEMCKAVGADSLIVHPPYLWEGEYARWITEECQAFCQSSGVTITVETMYPKWVAGRRLRAYRWLEPASLHHAAPFVAMDTSHLAVGRKNIVDAFHVLSPKLTHIHLSNNAGDGRDGHLELDRGIIPLDDLFTNIRRTKYSGAISLEISVMRYLEDAQELRKVLKRNRRFAESRLRTRGELAKARSRTELT